MEAVTTERPLKILVVEDPPAEEAPLAAALRHSGFHLEHVDRVASAVQWLDRTDFDAVVVDLRLADSRGFDTFLQIRDRAAGVAIIVCTNLEDEALGRRAVEEGAQDTLVKGDAGTALLTRAIHYAHERKLAEEVTARCLEELREKNAELREDLRLAHEVQEAFFPPRLPLLAPDARIARALHFSYRQSPVGMVGGDFFEVSRLSHDIAAVLICDVMGHGVRAALLTALLRSLVSEHRRAAADPGLMLEELNRALRGVLKGSDPPMFISAFYAVINVGTGQCVHANAGHPSPLRVTMRDEAVAPLELEGEPRGPALGLFEQAQYPTHVTTLERGERLLLYTDGAYELEGPQGERFGQARLRAAVGALSGLSSERFLDELFVDLRGFSSDGEFSDDTCLLTVDFWGEAAVDRPVRTLLDHAYAES